MPHKARSTRDRMLRNADYAIRDLERAVKTLKLVDDEAAERSPYIEEQLPLLIAAMEELRKAMVAFREGL